MERKNQKEFMQECLYTALMELLKKSTLEQISVSRLCEVAGVSRMTYYRNYSTKAEILYAHMDESFQKYYLKLKEKKNLTLYDVSLYYFQTFLGPDREFIQVMVNAGHSAIMMDKFYRYLEDVLSLLTVLEDKSPYFRSFLAGGLYKLSLDWFQGGADLSPEEMAHLLADVAP